MAPRDSSDVDIDALVTFAGSLVKQLSDFGKGMGAPLSQIGGAECGMSGTNEGQTFNAWHGGMVDALGKCIKDATTGHMALRDGIVTIAANYRNGDIDQSNAMTEVVDAFNPADGTATTASFLAKQEKKHPAAPHGDGKADKLPDPNPMVCHDEQHLTPYEQVQQHNALYGKHETWHPVDPNAPVEVDAPVALGPGEI